MENTIDLKQLEMAKRICNNKMDEVKDKDGKIIASDEGALLKMVNSAFDKASGDINNIQAFRDLNKLIVTTAEALAEPDIQKTINLVAQYQKVGANDVMQYDVNDNKVRVSMALTATGTGVDFTKIPSYKKKQFATARKHQFGVKYSVSRMISDPVNEFRNATQYVAEEKVKYVMSQIYIVLRNAVTASKIPAKQMHETAGITFPEFKAIESSLLRYGRNARPIMIADTAFISDLADKQASVSATGMTNTPLYLTDAMREHLLHDIEIEQISKTMAIAIDNPYTDRMNSKVDLPVDEAILVAGGSSSPFRVTDFGDMAVASDNLDINLETEEVNMKISYKVDITLLLTQAVGYIKNTNVTL